MATTISVLKFNSRFDAPLFTGSTSTPLVPAKFPVAIAGHSYQLIWDKDAIEVWGAKYRKS